MIIYFLQGRYRSKSLSHMPKRIAFYYFVKSQERKLFLGDLYYLECLSYGSNIRRVAIIHQVVGLDFCKRFSSELCS